MQRSILAACLGLMLAPAMPVHAFTLYPIPYSGFLTESGSPVNGTRYFTLRLYDAAVGGSPIRTQAESLAVVNGVYHTQFITQLGDWSGTDRWVGVSVDSDPELAPRVAIGTVPFAVRATQADSVRIGPGVAMSYLTIYTPIPNATWTPVASIFVQCPAAGFVTITFNGIVIDDSNPRMVGELSIGTPGSSPLQRFALTTGASGAQELPITLTKVIEVPAGGQSFIVYARNTDSFFGSFTIGAHGISARYDPKFVGLTP